MNGLLGLNRRGAICGTGPSFIHFIHVPRGSGGGSGVRWHQRCRHGSLPLPPSVSRHPRFSSGPAETVARQRWALILDFGVPRDFTLDSSALSSRRRAPSLDSNVRLQTTFRNAHTTRRKHRDKETRNFFSASADGLRFNTVDSTVRRTGETKKTAS